MTDNSSAGAYVQHKDYLLVQVPGDAKNIEVNEYEDGYIVIDWDIANQYMKIDLPPGTWQLIGLAAKVTEGQWMEIVESEEWTWGPTAFPDGRIDNSLEGIKTRWYKDYEKTLKTGQPHWSSFPAKDSGQSLLRSYNLNANQTVILKLIEA